MTIERTDENIMLEVKNLKKHFPIVRGMRKKVVGNVKAVDGISFNIYAGETLGLVGESGCGKSTTARLIMRAHETTDGDIKFRMKDGSFANIAGMNRAELKLMWREMQMIFQDPYSSLNPRMTLLQIIGEPLINHGIHKANSPELKQRVGELLTIVGLRAEHMGRYPHAFSGGQRQRVGIARALALNPRFIACDEAVSALDVSVQAQVINLLQDLQEEFDLTYLFITHDLSVVEHISDRVGVMYVGKIAELAPTREIFLSPKHPYTEALLSAVPKPDPRAKSKRIALKGEVANASNPPSGCYFHPRCTYAVERCKTEEPQLEEISPGHQVACHRVHELDLAGVLG